MTLSTTTSRISFAGNGVTTAFAVSFKFNADADLTVILRVDSTKVETTQVITTNYTVSGAGADSGGTVTMLTAPATGESLTIFRDAALIQETDYVENDKFPAEDHEDALDLLTMLTQRLDNRLDRAIVLSEGNTDSGFDPTLPETVVTAGAILIVKTDLSGFELTTVANIGDFGFPAGNGLLAKTGPLTSSARTITGTTDEIDVTAGDGVAGDPTLGLADNLVAPGNEKLRLPIGTSAQRPSSPIDGDERYNTDLENGEMRVDDTWVPYLKTKQGFINLIIQADTTTNANDSIKITSADGTALSADNPGFVIMGSTTAGRLVVEKVTADVTIDLTGADYSFAADLTDQELSVYALFDGGVKFGVALLNREKSFLDTLDSATPGDINLNTEILVNTALVADAAALEIAYFRADFDLTGGDAEKQWIIKTDLDDINLGPNPKVITASYNTNAGQSVANTGTTQVDFEDLVKDPFNTVTIGASWVFTAPRAMSVNVDASVLFSDNIWALGNFIKMELFKNGSLHKFLFQMEFQSSDNGGGETNTIGGSAYVVLAKGDTINAEVGQNGSGSTNLNNLATNNYINITEVI